MANDLINLGNSPTDAILGNSAISPDLLSQPLSPQTVQENQGQPMLPEPSISKAIQTLGIGLINGDQTGRGVAGGIADAASLYDGERQRAIRNDLIQRQMARQDRQEKLNEYELLGRMRTRQLAEAAEIEKRGSISRLKSSNPELADLIDLDPKSAAKAIAAKASGTVGIDSGLTGQPLLDSLPSQDAENVKLIVAGKLDPSKLQRQKIPYYTALAAKVDPTFDATNYSKRNKVINAFSSGSEAHTVNQLKTALNHGNDLYDKIDALHNIDGFPGATYANKIKNIYKDSRGDTAVNDYNNILGKYVDESTGVYLKGGGTEKDRAEAKAPLGNDKTTAQLKSAMRDSTNLMLGKLDALDDQYRQGTGTGLKYQFLSPKQRGILVKMGAVDPAEVGVDASAANLPEGSPAPIAQPAPVSQNVDPNAVPMQPASSVFENNMGSVPASGPVSAAPQGMLDDDAQEAADDNAGSTEGAGDTSDLSDQDIQALADKYGKTPDEVKQELGI